MHTPGPWIIFEAGNTMIFPAGRSEPKIAVVNPPDADLISAAPKLLAALEALTADISSSQEAMDAVSIGIFEDALDAIAQATGVER